MKPSKYFFSLHLLIALGCYTEPTRAVTVANASFEANTNPDPGKGQGVSAEWH